jgi:hypothetical protein
VQALELEWWRPLRLFSMEYWIGSNLSPSREWEQTKKRRKFCSCVCVCVHSKGEEEKVCFHLVFFFIFQLRPLSATFPPMPVEFELSWTNKRPATNLVNYCWIFCQTCPPQVWEEWPERWKWIDHYLSLELFAHPVSKYEGKKK